MFISMPVLSLFIFHLSLLFMSNLHGPLGVSTRAHKSSNPLFSSTTLILSQNSLFQFSLYPKILFVPQNTQLTLLFIACLHLHCPSYIILKSRHPHILCKILRLFFCLLCKYCTSSNCILNCCFLLFTISIHSSLY